MDERVGLIWGYVYSIFGHGLQLRIRRRARVPIELHVHATGKLDDYVAADRIVERRHDDVRAGRAGRANRSVHIGDQIPSPFVAEGIRHGRFKSENGERAARRKHQLRNCTTRCRRYSGDNLLRRAPAKCCDDACGEPVKIGWRNVNMGRIVLWADRNTRRSRDRTCVYGNRNRQERRKRVCCDQHGRS